MQHVTAGPSEAINDLGRWLAAVDLGRYEAAVKDYGEGCSFAQRHGWIIFLAGYHTINILKSASEQDISEMTEDGDIAMKKPHRKMFITAVCCGAARNVMRNVLQGLFVRSMPTCIHSWRKMELRT